MRRRGAARGDLAEDLIVGDDGDGHVGLAAALDEDAVQLGGGDGADCVGGVLGVVGQGEVDLASGVAAHAPRGVGRADDERLVREAVDHARGEVVEKLWNVVEIDKNQQHFAVRVCERRRQLLDPSGIHFEHVLKILQQG